MATFKVTPQELNTGESNLRRVAGDIASALGRAQGEVRRLTADWTGEAAGRFEDYMLEWNRLADLQQKNLDDVAKALGIAASNYQDAEDAAKNSFQA